MIGNFEEIILDNILIDVNGVLRLERLFTFNYPLLNEHKERFEKVFFFRYRFNEINYQSFNMFKDMLMSKLYELSPKYNKMYATEDAIKNPFINMMIETDNWRRERGRQKNYNEANAKSAKYDYGSNAEIAVSRSGVSGKVTNSLENTIEAVNKSKGLEDGRENNLDRFTDSPQKKDAEYLEDDGEFKTHILNDGYLTTARRNNNQNVKVNSKTDDNYQKTGEQSATDSMQSTDAYADNVTESENDSNILSYSDFYGVNAIENTQKTIANQYGLNNMTVSEAISQYRESIIAIDSLFLDELRDLFLYIY